MWKFKLLKSLKFSTCNLSHHYSTCELTACSLTEAECRIVSTGFSFHDT